MESSDWPLRDVAIPAVGLTTLRRTLQREAGALPAIHGLHSAGFGSGEAMWASLRRSSGRELADLDEATFWTRLAAALNRRGWGSLTHRAAHPGIGLLASPDWAEAAISEGERQPSCTFSAGMFAAILTGAAGGPIAVLEVTCRTCGDDRCTFAFGSSATMDELYGLLLDGQDLDAALASL